MSREKEVLEDLLTIYERRYEKSSNLKQKIKITINDSKYPKYFTDRTSYDEAFINLKDKGYINILYQKHSDVIDYIYLNINEIDNIYKYLGKTNEIDILKEELFNELNKYDNEIIKEFRNLILDRIDKNKSIKQYLNYNVIDSLKAIDYLEKLEKPQFIRNASNYLYNNSKRLKELESIINSIYNEEDIFSIKGIISTTQYILIKGDITIYINNSSINLGDVNTPIQIPLDNLDIISFDILNKVTTVENLTTFYDYNSSGLVVYLGGFPSLEQINFLVKLKKYTSNFYHFSDIDLGGFKILNYLREKVCNNYHKINMDINTLIEYSNYLTSIEDDGYLDKLAQLLEKPLLSDSYAVIKYLINNRIRLEQESIYNN